MVYLSYFPEEENEGLLASSWPNGNYSSFFPAGSVHFDAQVESWISFNPIQWKDVVNIK